MNVISATLACCVAALVFSLSSSRAQQPSAEAAESAENEEASDGDIADQLNSRQQLKQSFTLKRTINGEVVETKQETVTLSGDDPLRPTEAGLSTLERVRAAFDGEVLSRVEALEEAKLDFTIADVDRDGAMTAAEFADLVETMRARDAEQAEALDLMGDSDSRAEARKRFSFLAGAASAITREQYVREYLLDFDSMDANDDTFLRDEELARFRALNRGETLSLEAREAPVQ